MALRKMRRELYQREAQVETLEKAIESEKRKVATRDRTITTLRNQLQAAQSGGGN